MSEQEEFEFRHRLEAEHKTAKPTFAASGSEDDKQSAAVEPGVEAPHLDQSTPEGPESWGHWAGRKALSALPTVGMVAAGIAATPETAGAGTIPAAAAGYTAGKYLENAGRRHLLGEEIKPDPGGALGELVGAGGEGLDQAAQGEGMGKVLSPVGKYIAEKLKKTGIGAAIRHLRPTPSTARALGKEGLEATGQEALESGAIRPFQKVGSTAERLATAEEQAGNELGGVVRGSSAHVDPTDIHEAVTENVIKPLKGTTAGKRIAGPVQEKLDSLVNDLSIEGTAVDGVPLARIEAEKTMEQQANNYMLQSSGAKAADKAFASQLRQASENAIRQQDAASLPAFLAAKKRFGNLSNARDMAERTAGLTDGGTGLLGHIVDTGAVMEGIEGVATGNPIKMATPVARAATKGRVASTVATGAYGAGKGIEKVLPYANPVANAIASRLGSSSPRAERPHQASTVSEHPSETRKKLIDQQTNHSSQQELKDSQE